MGPAHPGATGDPRVEVVELGMMMYDVYIILFIYGIYMRTTSSEPIVAKSDLRWRRFWVDLEGVG